MATGVQCVMMAGTAMMPPQCADNWDTTTVCNIIYSIYKMTIKYTERAIPTREAYFGEGSGPIHLSRAECRINDTRLTDCTIDKTAINGCNHSEDAGVICIGEEESMTTT